jgi:hypothetical protein
MPTGLSGPSIVLRLIFRVSVMDCVQHPVKYWNQEYANDYGKQNHANERVEDHEQLRALHAYGRLLGMDRRCRRFRLAQQVLGMLDFRGGSMHDQEEAAVLHLGLVFHHAVLRNADETATTEFVLDTISHLTFSIELP